MGQRKFHQECCYYVADTTDSLSTAVALCKSDRDSGILYPDSELDRYRNLRAYMSQTSGQKRITISEVAADRHELINARLTCVEVTASFLEGGDCVIV